MSITKERMKEMKRASEERKREGEEEMAAITERVKHLEDLVGTSGADNSKLEQRLGTERERFDVLQSAVSSCDQMFAVLQSYSALMLKR